MRRRTTVITTFWLCRAAVCGAETDAAQVDVGRTRPVLLGNVALSVTGGQLGSDPLYNFSLGYFPTQRLALEATVAHNPASGVHAALHHFGALAPMWRLGPISPFVVAGLGTIQVFPGTAVNATTVTKLLVDAGGGAQLFLRDDVALRFEGRSFAVFDQQEDKRGTFQYAQWSVGLTFYRALVAPDSSEPGAAP